MRWNLVTSSNSDMLVKWKGERFSLIPLYSLVYHAAIMIPSGGLTQPRCLLNGGFAWIGQIGGKLID